MSYPIDLSDRVVVVTGGARGVGAGITETFLTAGAVVEICGRSTTTQVPTVEGRSAIYSPLDIRDDHAVADWLSSVHAKHGRIDVLVNNAGGSPFANFAEASPNFHRKVLELNFITAALVSHHAYSYLKDAVDGSIINITSISARRPSPGTAVYGAAKAALESLTGSLAVEWAPAVRVNAISSGLVRTDAALEQYGDAEQYARVAATIPRGQLATPAEIGGACLMLASPLASHITGAVLAVDGGGEWPAFLGHTPNAPSSQSDQSTTSHPNI